MVDWRMQQVNNAAANATKNGVTGAFYGNFNDGSNGAGAGYLHNGVETANTTLERMSGALATNLYNRDVDNATTRDIDANARYGTISHAAPNTVDRAAGQVGFQNNILLQNQNITRQEDALNNYARVNARYENLANYNASLQDSGGSSIHMGGRGSLTSGNSALVTNRVRKPNTRKPSTDNKVGRVVRSNSDSNYKITKSNSEVNNGSYFTPRSQNNYIRPNYLNAPTSLKPNVNNILNNNLVTPSRIESPYKYNNYA